MKNHVHEQVSMSEAPPVVKAGRVLCVDPVLDPARPTAQSLFVALPGLLAQGWEVEVWCLHHAPLDPRIKVRRLPAAPWLRLLEPLWFWLVVWLLVTAERLRGPGWDIVHTTGPDMPGADVMSLHFHNRTWLRLQWQDPGASWRDRLRLFHTLIGVTQETIAFASARWRVLLPVSEGLAGRVRPLLHPGKEIRVLANVLDVQRFHPGVRAVHRDQTRAELKASARDYVFIFVSTGHYQRKGLWPAVTAIKACRADILESTGLSVRLLVVGAGDKALGRLVPRLEREFPGWREWLDFRPPTSCVERWYAGADAFLFPSRYETFSLVALEASACGLPLLITPYDGHEMYLKAGTNGCLLAWDQGEMQRQLSHYMTDQRLNMRPGPAAFVDAEAYARSLDETYRSVMAGRKAVS